MLAPTDLQGKNPNPVLGVDVVNNSWGFPKEYSHIGKFYETPLKQLEDAGMLMVFAAGNDGPKADTVLWPGQSQHELSVGSTTRDDEVSDFSSRGKVGATGKNPDDRPDIVAPGSVIPSSIPTKGVAGELALVRLMNLITGGMLGDMSQYGPVPGARNGNYWTLSGTSMASPVATAVGAILLSANPKLNPQDVKRIMRETATDLGAPGWDSTYGAGLINIEAAVKAARAAKVA
jgi:subtilisin family serine protease